MKAIAAYLFTAIVLAAIGAACLGASRLDRDMAQAQRSVSALKYDEADQTFATAERYFEYASRLPWVGNGPVKDVQTRRAAIRYWKGQYGALTSETPDLDNGDIQLLTANAAYRSGRIQAKDRPSTVAAVDTGIQAYLGVLKNTSRQEDAAYNYEYLVRQREVLEDGGSFRLLRGNSELNGISGTALDPADTSKFKIYIPLEDEERNKAGGAGKAGPIKRKG